jgi:hypothetical protein
MSLSGADPGLSNRKDPSGSVRSVRVPAIASPPWPSSLTDFFRMVVTVRVASPRPKAARPSFGETLLSQSEAVAGDLQAHAAQGDGHRRVVAGPGLDSAVADPPALKRP